MLLPVICKLSSSPSKPDRVRVPGSVSLRTVDYLTWKFTKVNLKLTSSLGLMANDEGGDGDKTCRFLEITQYQFMCVLSALCGSFSLCHPEKLRKYTLQGTDILVVKLNILCIMLLSSSSFSVSSGESARCGC